MLANKPAPTSAPPDFLVLAASARFIVQTIAASGFQASAVDGFADLDTRQHIAHCARLSLMSHLIIYLTLLRRLVRAHAFVRLRAKRLTCTLNMPANRPAPTSAPPDFLVLAASARFIVQAIAASGFQASAVDGFADLDTRQHTAQCARLSLMSHLIIYLTLLRRPLRARVCPPAGKALDLHFEHAGEQARAHIRSA